MGTCCVLTGQPAHPRACHSKLISQAHRGWPVTIALSPYTKVAFLCSLYACRRQPTMAADKGSPSALGPGAAVCAEHALTQPVAAL